MTVDQARRLQAMVNQLVEAEREYVRAKLRFTSYERRARWADRVRQAHHEVSHFILSTVV